MPTRCDGRVPTPTPSDPKSPLVPDSSERGVGSLDSHLDDIGRMQRPNAQARSVAGLASKSGPSVPPKRRTIDPLPMVIRQEYWRRLWEYLLSPSVTLSSSLGPSTRKSPGPRCETAESAVGEAA